MKAATQHQIRLGGRRVDYRVVRSRAARKLRVRVGPNGVEVVQPAARNGEDVFAFLGRNEGVDSRSTSARRATSRRAAARAAQGRRDSLSRRADAGARRDDGDSRATGTSST